jgi:hypothetical protein
MWDQNYKNGFGIFTNSDGSQYIGLFKNDRMIDYNPQGIVTNSSLGTVVNKKGVRPITPNSNDDKPKNSNSTSANPLVNKGSSSNIQPEKTNKFTGNLDIIPEEDQHAAPRKLSMKEVDRGSQSQLPNPNDMTNSSIQQQIGKNVISNRAAKESEFNPYRVLLDVTDLIECEPEIEASLKEVENIMLRANSEIKQWYKMYVNKEYARDIGVDGDMNKSRGSKIMNAEEQRKVTAASSQLCVISENYANDLGFAMEIKELWRFLRDCNITGADFTLAQFNRLFYKGPKNYIEMFMVPEELDNKYLYEYIYKMIEKSKDEFSFKHRDKLNNNQVDQHFLDSIYKVDDIDITFDIHNKRQVILLRQFSEAIVRIAYLKYLNYDVPIHVKVRMLIENNIRTNALFKRLKRKDKSQIYTESSVNTSVVLDIKVKNVDSGMEQFISTYEAELKAIFKELYIKSTFSPKKYDMTITFRFLYENIIKKCPQFNSFLEKHKFVELINAYHKDKMVISDENKNTKEVFTYIENLLDIEMIFYEFCEVIFFISKKFFQNNNFSEKKQQNHFEIFKILDDQVKKLEFIYEGKEKYVYYYPKQKNHLAYEIILENRRLKEIEERKKAEEVRRYMMERKLLQLEDNNIVPVDDDGEEDEEDEEEDTYQL